MSLTALIHGKLVRDPVNKMSKAYKPFASALLKEGEGDAATWWSLLAFSESAIEDFSSLRAGDALAASGSFKAEIYEKANTRRISFSMFVDRLITAKKQKRERPALQAQSDMPSFDDGIAL